MSVDPLSPRVKILRYFKINAMRETQRRQKTSFGELNFHLAQKCLRSTEPPLSQAPC